MKRFQVKNTVNKSKKQMKIGGRLLLKKKKLVQIKKIKKMKRIILLTSRSTGSMLQINIREMKQ